MKSLWTWHPWKASRKYFDSEKNCSNQISDVKLVNDVSWVFRPLPPSPIDVRGSELSQSGCWANAGCVSTVLLRIEINYAQLLMTWTRLWFSDYILGSENYQSISNRVRQLQLFYQISSPFISLCPDKAQGYISYKGFKDQLSAKPLFLMVFKVYNITPAHLQSLG